MLLRAIIHNGKEKIIGAIINLIIMIKLFMILCIIAFTAHIISKTQVQSEIAQAFGWIFFIIFFILKTK